jgi:hypothetical protein
VRGGGSGTCGALPRLMSSSRFSRLSTKAVRHHDALLRVGKSKGPLYNTDPLKYWLAGHPIPSKTSINLAGSGGTGIEILELVGRWELEQDVVSLMVHLMRFHHVGDARMIGLHENPGVVPMDSRVRHQRFLDQNFVLAQEIGQVLSVDKVLLLGVAVHHETICNNTSDAVGVVTQSFKYNAASHERWRFKCQRVDCNNFVEVVVWIGTTG